MVLFRVTALAIDLVADFLLKVRCVVRSQISTKGVERYYIEAPGFGNYEMNKINETQTRSLPTPASQHFKWQSFGVRF